MLHSQCSQFPLLQFHFVDFVCQLSDSFIKLELTRWKVESLVQYNTIFATPTVQWTTFATVS